ncbi:MAG: hypothetical protein ABSG25_11675 [Bryobacteraceae bacterium]
MTKTDSIKYIIANAGNCGGNNDCMNQTIKDHACNCGGNLEKLKGALKHTKYLKLKYLKQI